MSRQLWDSAEALWAAQADPGVWGQRAYADTRQAVSQAGMEQLLATPLFTKPIAG